MEICFSNKKLAKTCSSEKELTIKPLPMRTSFTPDYATAPGETLRETLDALAMSPCELAAQTGCSPSLINKILKSKATLMEDTAAAFERVLNVPAAFWCRLEAAYRAHLPDHPTEVTLQVAEEEPKPALHLEAAP